MTAPSHLASGATVAGYAEVLRRRGRPVVAMPAHDAVIDATEPALRRAIGETWKRRAHEELKAAMSFTLLSRALLEVGAAPDVLARVTRAVSDEVRHAEALRALASRYLGEDVPWPPPVHIEDELPGLDPRRRAALHVVTLCCVSESIASVFFEAAHDAAVSPSARATLGLVLADEVEHARAGWVYLASTRDDGDRDVRESVQSSLATVTGAVVEAWFDFSAITLPHGAPEHGLLANDDVRRCVVTALRDIIVPGFAQVGLDVEALRHRDVLHR